MSRDVSHGAADAVRPLRVCVIDPAPERNLPTFVRAHLTNLGTETALIHDTPPRVGDSYSISQLPPARILRTVRRKLQGLEWHWELTWAYLAALRSIQPDVVLSEWGPLSVSVMHACEIAGIPQVAHFHGYDVSIDEVVALHLQGYRELFSRAAAVVVVSQEMRRKLISWGCDAGKIHWNPCSVDCSRFSGAEPARAGPSFLAVGRFVEKKAPDVTLRAFAEVQQQVPDARLVMVGDGPLLASCRDLSTSLGIADRVEFLGSQPHAVVEGLMRQARAFVQHSVRASNGDCEGTPVSVLEAGASGLPVVSTRHGGIVDVVIERGTGILVNEHDVGGMAAGMLELARRPEFAGELGTRARLHIRENFSVERGMKKLLGVLEGARARAPKFKGRQP